jgi:hypothetical protein
MKNFMMLNSFFKFPKKKIFYCIIKMFGLKDNDLVLVLFVLFGFFIAKMLSNKKEGYSPIMCDQMRTEDCCIGPAAAEGNKYDEFCEWSGNTNTCSYRDKTTGCVNAEFPSLSSWGRINKSCKIDADCCNHEACYKDKGEDTGKCVVAYSCPTDPKTGKPTKCNPPLGYNDGSPCLNGGGLKPPSPPPGPPPCMSCDCDNRYKAGRPCSSKRDCCPQGECIGSADGNGRCTM